MTNSANSIAKIIRKEDVRIFLEGPEICRDYVRNDTMWFGTSTLMPGQTGAIDRGHAKSIEVFYVAKGHVVIFDETRYYELHEGDALEIPPGLPHTLTNVGEETAVLVWSGAPGE